MNKKQLKEKIDSLGEITLEQRNSIICSLIGHSNIQTTFFGYHNCGRCGEQVGDSLGGIYFNNDEVIIGHNCDTCRDNFKKCTWKDKLYVKDPFKCSDWDDEYEKLPYLLEL